MNETDKDTWDVSFPVCSDEDIILWNSYRFSEDLDEDELRREFLLSLKSGLFVPVGMSVLSASDKKDNDLLCDMFFDTWYEKWFDEGLRWKAMANSLDAVANRFERSPEYLPSGGVFCHARGWSPKGIGHFYGYFKCSSVSRLIERCKKVLIPDELDDDEEISLIVPENGTLSLHLLKGQCFTISGQEEEDDDGSLIYEYGTVMEFYHVKEPMTGSFETWSRNQTTINNYCDQFIKRSGKAEFVKTYLEPIRNVVEHVWTGKTIEPKWDIKKRYKIDK